MPLIPLTQECMELIAKICCDTVGTPSAKQVKEYCYNLLCDEDYIDEVSMEAGRRGIPYIELTTAFDNVSEVNYICGAIESDYDHLLTDSYTRYIKQNTGEFRAKKCMDKIGYTNNDVAVYLKGALERENANTIKFLKEKELNLDNIFASLVLKNLIIYSILFGLKQGLKLTESVYNTLKIKQPYIYKQLQEQV